MPRADGTGPAGAGPMTGRGAGGRAGFTARGPVNPRGRGGAMGRGRRRGFRRAFRETGLPGWMRRGYPASDGTNPKTVDEEEALKNQAEVLQRQLQQVQKRLANLKPQDDQ